MTAILEQLQGLVAAAEIPAGTLGVALILRFKYPRGRS